MISFFCMTSSTLRSVCPRPFKVAEPSTAVCLPSGAPFQLCFVRDLQRAMASKATVVIDDGAWRCRAGLADSKAPTAVFPPVVGVPRLQVCIRRLNPSPRHLFANQ